MQKESRRVTIKLLFLRLPVRRFQSIVALAA